MSTASNLTPNDYIRLKATFKDMSEVTSKIEMYQATIKETKKSLKDEFKDLLTPAEINKLFQLHHKENGEEYFEGQSELEEVFQRIETAKEGE